MSSVKFYHDWVGLYGKGILLIRVPSSLRVNELLLLQREAERLFGFSLHSALPHPLTQSSLPQKEI